MKKMIVTAFMLASVGSITYAQNVKTNAASSAPQDANKTKIDPANLPDVVKTTLASDQYKGWATSGVWVVKADAVYYSIELKKDDKTITVNIGADGKVK